MLNNQATFTRVVECISASTRYPIELLTAEADLENDLGIDSVKRLEIVVALEDEFGLRLSNQERDPAIRSIADIARWIEGFLPANRSEPAVTSNNVRQDSSQSAVPVPARPESNGRLATNGYRAEQNGYAAAPQAEQLPEQHYKSENGQSQPHSVPSPHFPTNGASATNGTPATNGFSAANGSPAVNGSSSKPLAGRIAFVTGSGHSIGRVTARLLASKGATVIVNSFHSRDAGDQTVREINEAGGSAVHIWGSVANPGHLNHMFSQIESQFGRLDILVCNASDGRIGSFMELTPDDWDRAFRTNVVGHHQCAVKAAPLMRAAGGGSIVTMSAVGSKGWVDGLGSQGVVKAGVETLTRYLACELAQFGIRANCVAGGPVYGDLLDKFPDARNVQNQWEKNTPDGQLCNPMDLANAIAFLVSDEAKGINGAVWVVDHGFSAVAGGSPKRVGERERAAPAHGDPIYR